MWEYNPQTDQWGTFTSATSFDTTPYYLWNWNSNGRYGISSCISDDGNTAVIGTVRSNNSGTAYVWQYNAETYHWGHYTDSGDFAGQPIANDTSSSNLIASNNGFEYGWGCDISADGRYIVVGGNQAYSSSKPNENGGNVWVWTPHAQLESRRITNLTIVSQAPYYQTHSMSKAMDGVYSGAGIEGWISADQSDTQLGSAQVIWGWIDLGATTSITRVRLWQNEHTASSYPEERYINGCN